jgi:hypothetical protein
MNIDPQEFGRLEGKVEALKERVDANSVMIKDIHEFVTKQKGAAHILLLLCTGVSALVGWFVSYFSK